jgi:hypothetical protein
LTTFFGKPTSNDQSCRLGDFFYSLSPILTPRSVQKGAIRPFYLPSALQKIFAPSKGGHRTMPPLNTPLHPGSLTLCCLLVMYLFNYDRLSAYEIRLDRAASALYFSFGATPLRLCHPVRSAPPHPPSYATGVSSCVLDDF